MMANDCAKRCYAKIVFAGKGNFSMNKEKKTFFVETVDQLRHLEVSENVRNVFVMSLRLSDKNVLHDIASSSIFSISLGFSRFFRSFVVLPNFWSLRD